MKTTLDLPDDLMQQVKQRALQQGYPIKELDPAGMPLFRPDPGFSGPPIDLATALQLDQETLMQEDRQRAGLSA